jgi:small subunit ribosomal protein S16
MSQGDTTDVSVKIRLKRLGKIRVPQYRIVVVDSRKKRDGRVIEEIGKYHPKEDPSFIEVKSERAQYWLGVGAQPSEPVAAILKVTGDWQKFKGLPGAEGTLRMAEPKRDKLEIFNEALKDAAKQPKAEAVTKRAAKKAAAPAPEAEKPADEPEAEKPADTPAEVPAEAPAAEVETPAEAPAATPAEAPAEVPADETPEGATEAAEAAADDAEGTAPAEDKS